MEGETGLCKKLIKLKLIAFSSYQGRHEHKIYQFTNGIGGSGAKHLLSDEYSSIGLHGLATVVENARTFFIGPI